MTYTNAANKAAQKYVRTKQKQIAIKYKKEEFEERILPAIEASGLQTATFIKRAVEEKIERDQKKNKHYRDFEKNRKRIDYLLPRLIANAKATATKGSRNNDEYNYRELTYSTAKDMPKDNRFKRF